MRLYDDKVSLTTTVLNKIIFIFFFNDTATTEIYTLSLHDALPISIASTSTWAPPSSSSASPRRRSPKSSDRKSTRLNSSHGYISYAVFCLKKKNNEYTVKATFVVAAGDDLAGTRLSLMSSTSVDCT